MATALKVFSGSSNPELAKMTAKHLGIPLGRAFVAEFPNGETRVRIEENVRGLDVFLVQSVCSPVDTSLMQLLIMIDAVKRASADRITAVIPYFGYARQEKKMVGREPISAKLVASILAVAGADRILTMDLHAPAIEGFFDIPVDHLRAAGLLAKQVQSLDLEDAVVGSPDAGGVARAEDFSRRLGASDLFVVFKRRDTPDEVTPLHLVGNVAGRVAIIIDDIISTGQSLITAADSLLEEGAKEVHACAVHADFTQAVVDRLESSSISSILVTDTIPIHNQRQTGSKIKVCSTGQIFAETINRIHGHESVSALFS